MRFYFSNCQGQTRTFSFASLVVLATFFVDPAFCQAQFLPMKSDVASTDDDSADVDATDGAQDASDQDGITLWERQFLQTLELIDSTIEAIEEEYDAAARELNPLVRGDRERGLKGRLIEAVSGKKIVVFYTLSNIQAGKALSRSKQVFKITLESPTFPGTNDIRSIDVVMSPTQARQLTLGCVVRVEGELGKATRKSFASVQLSRAATYYTADGKRTTSGLVSRGGVTREYSVPLYFESVRVVSEAQLEQYKAFTQRLKARIDPFKSS